MVAREGKEKARVAKEQARAAKEAMQAYAKARKQTKKKGSLDEAFCDYDEAIPFGMNELQKCKTRCKRK